MIFVYMFTILLSSYVLQNNCNTIQQLHIFFRHGERSPTETYPSDPYINYSWSGGWGHLTTNGKLQMYKLGQLIRKRYSYFISEYYYPEDVEILSSYSDRCLMSAQLFLAGLFPPKGSQIWNEELLWQPIPIKYTPRKEDRLIVMKKFCKKYEEDFQMVLDSAEIKMIDAENAKLYQILTNSTGSKINSLGKVELLYNTLEIELLNNLTLPFWIQQVSLKQMKFLASKSLALYTHTNYMKRMKGGVFFKKIIENMKNNNKPNVYLYSGHDLSIVNILRTLGAINLLKPGFGASFVVELHTNSEVKIIYRDDVTDDNTTEELLIPNCEAPCLIADFETTLKPFLPGDWEIECNNLKS